MPRVSVCLFFLAIFQIGILKSSGDETTTEDKLAQDKEATSKVETEDKSEVTAKLGKASDVSPLKDDKPNEKKSAKNNESKKEDVIEKIAGGDTTKFLPNILTAVKGDSGNQTNVLFGVPKTILAPVNAVGAKIHEVVAKSLDTAKEFAGGTYNFLRSTFNGPFGNN